MRQHIALHEIVCPCKKCKPVINDEFLDMVEASRVIADCPFIFTSFYRCPDYNRKIGGASNSPHPMGIACDIAIRDRNRARKILDAAVKVGFNGIELCDRHIHLDIMERANNPVAWANISK